MKRHRNRSNKRRRLFESIVRSWNRHRRITLAGLVLMTGSSVSRSARAEEPAVMDEVVVTGDQQKRPSSPKYTAPVRDIPQTITIVPQEIIKEQGATTLRDVLRNVPGISMQAGEGGVPLGDNLSIRGFSARTDIFVDGVRDFGGYTRDSFNVEQVEVVKGPASSYSGRGSTGGSINLATKAPRLNNFRDVSLGVGTDDYLRGTIDVNQALPMAGSAFRLNALWHGAETPDREPAENERWGVAPSVAFGLDTPTRLKLYYSHFEQDNQPDYGIPWVPETNNALADDRNQPPPVDFDNYYGLNTRDFEDTTTDLATLIVERDLGTAFTLRNLLRWGQTERDSAVTSPRFASVNSTDINRQLQERLQEDEVLADQLDLTSRFRTGTVKHALITGVEVARETFDRTNRAAPTAPLADLYNPNPDDPFSGSLTPTGASTEVESDSIGVYAFDNMDLTDRWILNVGLRWDRFKTEQVAVSTAGVSATSSRTDEMPSWRAGIVFKPVPEASLYVSYGTSYNPAAEGLLLSDTPTNAASARLDPEESQTFEIGAKRDVFNGRLALSAAFFQTQKTNVRTEDPTNPNDFLVLEGQQRVNGQELAATGNLTRDWMLTAAATFMQSEVLESKNQAEEGLELSNTPKQSYSLWTTYQLPLNFEIGGGAQFVGSRFNNTNPVTRRQAPSYCTYDAMAAYSVNKNLTLRANAYNLGDAEYISGVGGGHFIPGAGRSFTLTTDVRF